MSAKGLGGTILRVLYDRLVEVLPAQEDGTSTTLVINGEIQSVAKPLAERFRMALDIADPTKIYMGTSI